MSIRTMQTLIFLVVLVTNVCCASRPYEDGYVCPKQWYIHMGTGDCYLYSTKLATFDEAIKECKAVKGELANIDDDDEHLLVSTTILETMDRGCKVVECRGLWFGYRKIKDVWTLLNGKTLEQQYWEKGYPTKTGNCAMYHTPKGEKPANVLWKDDDCSKKHGFICRGNDKAVKVKA